MFVELACDWVSWSPVVVFVVVGLGVVLVLVAVAVVVAGVVVAVAPHVVEQVVWVVKPHTRW